jgi:hypothetical protein
MWSLRDLVGSSGLAPPKDDAELLPRHRRPDGDGPFGADRDTGKVAPVGLRDGSVLGCVEAQHLTLWKQSVITPGSGKPRRQLAQRRTSIRLAVSAFQSRRLDDLPIAWGDCADSAAACGREEASHRVGLLSVGGRVVEERVVDGASRLGMKDNCHLDRLFWRKRAGNVGRSEAFELCDEAVDRKEGNVE